MEVLLKIQGFWVVTSVSTGKHSATFRSILVFSSLSSNIIKVHVLPHSLLYLNVYSHKVFAFNIILKFMVDAI
jgi:hypothetical protein